MECGARNRVEIYSINYDFLQTIPYSQKVLWVQLRYPAPASLRIGDKVHIVSTDSYFNPPSDMLRVVDIVGTRVSLTSNTRDVYACNPPCPFGDGTKRVGRWHPWSHSYGTWGYQTRDVSDFPYAYRQWTYGNGVPISYLVW